jgi:hypothetical protein
MTNAKIFTAIFMTAILAVSLVLAGTSNPTSLTFENDDFAAVTVELTSLISGAQYDVTTSTLNPSTNVPLTFTVSGVEVAGTVLTTSGTTATIMITPSTDYSDLDFESYTTSIILTKQTSLTDTVTDTVTIPVDFVRTFCDAGEQADVDDFLEITNIKINNNDGNDDEWSPLDEIEVEVEVTNNDNDRIKDVMVEIGLFDSQGKNIIRDMDDLNDRTVDLGSIKEDKDETTTFTFTIPSDFEDDSYSLVIKAYSDDNDFGEDVLCTSKTSELSDDFFEKIDGERETDEENHILFDKIQVTPSPAQCSEKVQVTGKVANIGDEDYVDQIRVTLFNSELGVNTEQIIRQDFDQGDSEVVDFEFDVPATAAEKLYTLEFRTYFDYDEDDDTYDLVSDDKYTATFRVAGNCNTESSNVAITATLNSETPEAVPGKQVIINTVIKNNGDVDTIYAVSVAGNSGWSTLSSIEPQIVPLGPGESRDVSIALLVNDDATGDNELTISASFDGKKTDQRIVLSIAEGKSMGSNDLGPFVNHLRDNWFIYLIVLVNVVLIVAIILVIRSMVSPRPL